jgi:hypothetical protein
MSSIEKQEKKEIVALEVDLKVGDLIYDTQHDDDLKVGKINYKKKVVHILHQWKSDGTDKSSLHC